MKKYIIIFIVAFIGGICGFTFGDLGIDMGSIFIFIPVLILELILFVISHELNHGFAAERNGLKFTVLYLGPFTFKRENKKFKRIKGTSNQLAYLGRAQIDNGEILNEEDVNKHIKSWIKALQAGPLSDVILSIIMIILGFTLKFYVLIATTIVIDIFMFLPSYIIGDGKHIKQMKKDKVFSDIILYTYSIAGNTPISKQSKEFLLKRIVEDINNNVVTKENLISMTLATQSAYQGILCEDLNSTPKGMEKIVDMAIKNKNMFLKKQIEQTYYKSLINFSIIYEVIINNNKERALELYEEVKNEKHDMPGEKLDYYRVQHVLEIYNRKSEILNENLMNPVFKGCEGITRIEEKVNEIILAKSFVR
ncbi:MAG: site-2 protease family protein [Terrisporobacter sp.]|uniref:site-2 protease family protein n=1 Tax=Terrisporobacter sp. TaxID=1965305 RepID=UPI002FC7C43E